MFSGEIHEARTVIKQLCDSQQEIIMEQIGDLVRKGILVALFEQPVIVTDDGTNFRLTQKVKFELKEQEYIKKIEQENIEMRHKLLSIKSLFREL